MVFLYFLIFSSTEEHARKIPLHIVYIFIIYQLVTK
jgi:hypothetical protein